MKRLAVTELMLLPLVEEEERDESESESFPKHKNCCCHSFEL